MGKQHDATTVGNGSNQTFLRHAGPPLGRVTWALLLGWLAMAAWSLPGATAQQAEVIMEQGRVRMAPAPSGGRPVPNQPPGQGPNQPNDKQNAENKDGKPDAKEEAKPKEGDTSSPAPLTRPDQPGFTVDPAELDIEPDEDGNIQFSFRGQPWLDVLQWLAGVSGLSLDWFPDLPGDYLNLTTHRKYSLAEARDLINRHLLSRGYTLIVEGEVLHVVKMDELDPSMVPHVAPDELADLLPSTVVKTTFDLPKDLQAEQAVEDVKQLLSEHGKKKVQALKATNRIFVIDQVANLMDVQRMISAERQELEGHIVPRTFVLRHARATDVVQTLKELLGMPAGGQAIAGDPNQMQQMMQQMQQQMQKQMQQMQQQQGGGGGGGGPAADEVFLVAVPRRNIILANASPRKIEIIESAIEVLDEETAPGESLTGNMHRWNHYRLVSLDPEIVVNTLQEVGNLDPRTRLQADKSSRSIMAFATLADHVVIKSLIDRLDGAGREIKVIRLRRLPADQMAGTIEYIMGGADEDENQNSRSRYYGYIFGYYGRQQEEAPKDKFRVEADVERNRLILWANESELEEVNNFLVQMGEMPAGSIGPQTVRVVDIAGGDQTDAVLERLQQVWGNGANNLIIEDNRPSVEESPSPASEPSKRNDVVLPDEDRQTSNSRLPSGIVRFAQLTEANDAHPATDETPQDATSSDVASQKQPATARGNAAPEAFRGSPDDWGSGRRGPDPQTPQGPPPVRVTVTEDGRIRLQSQDPTALDMLEDMILDMATPTGNDFEVFYIKNVAASWVALDLQDYFKDELAEDTSNLPPWYRYEYGTNEDDLGRLSRRRKLTILYNFDANAVIVRGATPEQLRVIKRLIAVFDHKPEDDASSRRTEVVKIKYSSARVVADAIKEAYRDLLSSKDTAFQNQQNQQEQNGRNTTTTERRVYIYDYGSGDDAKKPTPVEVSFEGALSLGVDEISNMIIISAQEELIGGIVKIAEYLDEQAKPNTSVAVHRVRNVDAASLHAMLAKTLVDPWTGGKRPQVQGQQQQPKEGEQPPQEGGEGRQRGPGQNGNGRGDGNGTTAVYSQ